MDHCLAEWTSLRSLARSRCSRRYRCRSCRDSDFRRYRAYRFRDWTCRFRCRVFRASLSQSRRCRRDRSSAPCPGPHCSTACRRGTQETPKGRRTPTLHPDHTGIDRSPRGRPTRRRAHANPPRYHLSRCHRPAIHKTRQFWHKHGKRFCCGDECTRDRDTPIPPMIRTIMLGCSITALS